METGQLLLMVISRLIIEFYFIVLRCVCVPHGLGNDTPLQFER